MSFAVEQMLLTNKASDRNTAKKHELFAIEYMVDFDIIRAYKKVYDEDGTMDDIGAQKSGSRLLRSVVVQEVIDSHTCKYIATRQKDKDNVVLQMKRLYFESMRDKDYASAKGALDMLAKHYGLYHAHNRQKKYSPEDVVALRQKLEANGLSFEATNKPIQLEQHSEISSIGIEDAQIVERKEE